MCEFLIILHIVSLSLGLTFTPGIGWTTICCALRTQSYCTHYRWIWFPCPLICGQMSLNTSKDARTSLHDNPRRLATMLRSARHRISQKKNKIIYITWKVLWGQFVPQAEINTNKK